MALRWRFELFHTEDVLSEYGGHVPNDARFGPQIGVKLSSRLRIHERERLGRLVGSPPKALGSPFRISARRLLKQAKYVKQFITTVADLYIAPVPSTFHGVEVVPQCASERLERLIVDAGRHTWNSWVLLPCGGADGVGAGK